MFLGVLSPPPEVISKSYGETLTLAAEFANEWDPPVVPLVPGDIVLTIADCGVTPLASTAVVGAVGLSGDTDIMVRVSKVSHWNMRRGLRAGFRFCLPNIFNFLWLEIE